MNDLFATIYEFGGMLPLYAANLGDHLRGFDVTCSGFIGTPWYTYIGIVMVGLTAFGYLVQYHLLDSARYNSARAWWITVLLVCCLNFVFAFTVTLNSVHSGEVCKQLTITTGDIFGFSISNIIVSFTLFVLITSVPYIRAFSTNCKHTTFWKP